MASWFRSAMSVVALVSILGGCSGEDPEQTTPPTTAVKPEPTPVGTPTGDPVVATLGPEGGSLSSADGVLTLTIPPGAVSSPTEFGVQPITNNAPASIGGAYRLSPEGQTFSKPAQITMIYEDADIQATVPGALSIGFQDDTGLWEWQKDASLDAAARSITISTPHLSDWSRVYGMQIHAENDIVKLNETVGVQVLNCVYPVDDGRVYVVKCSDSALGDDLAQLIPKVDEGSWAVNGGSGAAAGVVKATGRLTATYTAPAKKPSSNPVAVSVKTLPKGELLVANITVQGRGYHVVWKQSATDTLMACTGAPSETMTDQCEFTLTDAGGGDFTVDDIKNTTATFTPPTITGGTVEMDTDPELFTLTSGTAWTARTTVAVELKGTTTSGGCTITFRGSRRAVTFLGNTQPGSSSFVFDTTKFEDGTQTVEDPAGQWTATVTEE